MRDRVLYQIKDVQPDLYHNMVEEFGLPENGKQFIEFIIEADKRTK